MKKLFLLFGIVFLGVMSVAIAATYQNNCRLDQKTGNTYCYRSLSSRYSGFSKPDYSDGLYRNTNTYYQNRQVCPINSHYERFPVNACICNQGYESTPDKSGCRKLAPVLSDQGMSALIKALQGQNLTPQERGRKGEIIQWLNNYFDR